MHKLYWKTKYWLGWKKRTFLDKIKKIKSNNLGQTNEHYDVVVPWSGGKDSTSIALKLKFELGLNPLLVTFSPLILNELENSTENYY